MFEGMEQYTVYGEGYRTLYKSGDLIKVISKSKTLTDINQTVYIYNADGEPIFIRTPQYEAYYKNGETLNYDGTVGYAKTLYDIAVKAMQESIAR